MNITPEYKKYLEDSRAAGLTDVQIRSALLRAGWTDVQAGDLFDSYGRMIAQTEQSLPEPILQRTLPHPYSDVEDADSFSHIDEKVNTENPKLSQDHELAQRYDIFPQVEPQELRPHISHPSYAPEEKNVEKTDIITEKSSFEKSNFDLSPVDQSPPALSPVVTPYAVSMPTPTPTLEPVRPSVPLSQTVKPSAGIASYQTGSQLSTPIQKQSTQPQQVTSNAPSPVSDMNIVTGVSSMSANNVNLEKNSGRVTKKMEVRTMDDGRIAAGDVIFNDEKKGAASALKKVFIVVLVLAFLTGSGVYAYMQFVNPFVLMSDESLLAVSFANFAENANNLNMQSKFELYTVDELVLAFAVDTTQKTENQKLSALNLRMYDFVINPENKLFALPADTSLSQSPLVNEDAVKEEIEDSAAMQTPMSLQTPMPASFVSNEMQSIIEDIDVRFLFLNNILYAYPGTLLKQIPSLFSVDQSIIDSLFETWIVFDGLEAGEGIAENLSIDVTADGVRGVVDVFNRENLPEYTLTSSVKDKEKYLNINFMPESTEFFIRKILAESGIDYSQEDLGAIADFQYQVNIEIVIASSKQIKNIKIEALDSKENIKSIIRADFVSLDDNLPPIMVPEKVITLEELFQQIMLDIEDVSLPFEPVSVAPQL